MELISKGEKKKANITEASFKAASLIAKTGTSHTIAENLVKPDAKVMTNLMLTERKQKKLLAAFLPEKILLVVVGSQWITHGTATILSLVSQVTFTL